MNGLRLSLILILLAVFLSASISASAQGACTGGVYADHPSLAKECLHQIDVNENRTSNTGAPDPYPAPYTNPDPYPAPDPDPHPVPPPDRPPIPTPDPYPEPERHGGVVPTHPAP
jgi:outer membrane biosynthesis protein TonB